MNLLHLIVPTEVTGRYLYLQDITIQRYILIPLNLVHMLISVSRTVFLSVCIPLVAIRSSASAQLVSSGLLSCHDGGVAEEAAEESVDA